MPQDNTQISAPPPGLDGFLATPSHGTGLGPEPEGLDSFIAPEVQEEKYGTPGQQAITALEGIGKGALGPIAPAVETSLGVDPEDIRARSETNPVTAGVGEAAGLVGSLYIPGVGQANVLSKAGKAAQAVTGLAKVAEGSSLGFKVGSVAVAQAAEMAVYQGGDEVAKMILKDPDQTAETAMTNIGLATVLGGGIGAGFGSVSPLWSATIGPKFEKTLSGLKDHLNGGGKLKLPEEIEAAQKTLGIEISPATRAGMSGDPKAAAMYNELRESQNPAIINDIKTLEKGSSDAITKSLGIDTADILAYNEADTGHNLRNTFLKEYKEKYGPVADQLSARDAVAEGMAITDDSRLKLYGDLLENGMKQVGTDSPFYKLYHDYGNRILAKSTLGELDKLSTEIGRSMRSMGTNNNEKFVLNDIYNSLKSFKEEQVVSQTKMGYGPGGFAKQGADVLAQRDMASQGYKQFAEMSDKLMNHLGVGDFRGYKGLVDKLNEAGPEALLRKFSPKGDADLIPFLYGHFPETFKLVQENELKKLIKPAVLAAKGENDINIKKLSSIIEKGLAGEKAYIESILSPEALQKIKAADALVNALPEFKSSGTAGWMTKMYKNMPASVMAAVGWVTSHNPVSAYLAGHLAQYLGKSAPDALKLSFLKFIASDAPIKASGFKAMADLMVATYKGEKLITQSVNNIFKPSIRVLSDIQMPSTRQIERLDKLVASNEQQPNDTFNMATKDNDLAHYMPHQQVALSKSAANVMTYLKGLKPKSFKSGPLNRAIEPSTQEVERYNRALEVAQQPAVVLQHIKDGTLLPSDVLDIKSMYPALYNSMVSKLSNEMVNSQHAEEPIPYKTRLGLSLFLGQPVDSSMSPDSILKAQPPPPQPPQAQGGGNVKRSTSSLGKKTINSSMTPTQGAESSRQTRD